VPFAPIVTKPEKVRVPTKLAIDNVPTVAAFPMMLRQ